MAIALDVYGNAVFDAAHHFSASFRNALHICGKDGAGAGP